MWLTVPILNKSGKLLNQVEIDYSKNWVSKHKSAIKFNYEHSPFFDTYWDTIKAILDDSNKKLIDLNMSLINYFISVLQIKTKIVFSSDLHIDSAGSKKLLDICKTLHADTYLSGEFGKNYLDMNIFENEKIQIIFDFLESSISNSLISGVLVESDKNKVLPEPHPKPRFSKNRFHIPTLVVAKILTEIREKIGFSSLEKQIFMLFLSSVFFKDLTKP